MFHIKKNIEKKTSETKVLKLISYNVGQKGFLFYLFLFCWLRPGIYCRKLIDEAVDYLLTYAIKMELKYKRNLLLETILLDD